VGIVSVTTAPVTDDGPLFVTVIVYVVDDPSVTDDTPSDFVTARSACGTSFVSVAELLPDTGSVVPVGGAIVAVFAIVFTLFATSTVAVTVNEYVSPDASVGRA
jgi:hypothetical protein